MLPNFGYALLTLTAIIAGIISGIYVLAYAAHCLVTVVEQTAAGADAVVWPDEPTTDWMSRAVFLGALLAIWLTPAGIMARVLRDELFPGDPGMRLLVLAIPGLWIFFPIGLLSSLSSPSRMGFFQPGLVGALTRVGLPTLVFYALSGVVAAVTATVIYFALFTEWKVVIVVLGPVAAACFLIYARLIGRLGLHIRRLNPPKEERDEQPRKKKKKKRPENTEEEPEILQVAERPADEDDEWSGGSYGMSSERGAKPPEFHADADYHIDEMGPKVPDVEPESSHGPSDQIQTAARRTEAPKPKYRRTPPAPLGPPWPLLQGVYTFPWYPGSVGSWVWLSVGFGVVGGCVAMAVYFYPTG